MYGNIGDECWKAGCRKTATHVLTTKITYVDEPPMEFENKVAYCLADALYFAAWLPYCYPNEQELVSIMPPASELFNRVRSNCAYQGKST